MNKQKIIIYLFVLLGTLMSYSSMGQRVIDFVVSLDEPYPLTYGQLIDDSRFDIMVLNDIPRAVPLYFKSEIRFEGADSYTIRTINEKTMNPVVTIGGNEDISFKDHISFKDLGYTFDNLEGLPDRFTQLDNVLDFTNTNLDEGRYTICITAFDFDTDLQLSTQVCNINPFVVESANLVLNFVDDQVFTCDEVLDELVFDWRVDARINIGAEDCFTYNVVIAEVPSDANRIDAINDPSLHVTRLGGISVDDITFDNSELRLDEKQFEDGKTYAVQITAIDKPDNPEGCTVLLKQDDKSQIVTFQVSCDDPIEEVAYDYSCEDCEEAAPRDMTAYSYPDLPDVFQAGYFPVEVKSSTKQSDTFSGEGVIKFSLFGVSDIPVKVKFSEVKLNSAGAMVAGEIVSVMENIENIDISVSEDAEFALSDLGEEAYAELVKTTATVANLLNDVNDLVNGTGLETPLGFDQEINGEQYKFLIENLRFSHDKASITISANFPFGDEGSVLRYIPLAVRDLCLLPNGTFGPGEYPLTKDIVVIDKSKIDEESQEDTGHKVTLNGCSDCAESGDGSYIKFDCSGPIGFQIDMSVLLPEDVFIPALTQEEPTPADGGEEPVALEEEIDNRVAANAKFYLSKEDDQNTGWLASVGISPFTMKSLDEWVFEVQDATLDFSDAINPSNLVFPNNHETYGPTENESGGLVQVDGDLLNLWQGIFIKSVHVVPPKEVRGDVLKAFKAENLIIDLDNANGSNMSAVISVEDPFTGRHDIGNWAIELEKIYVAIINNDFESGGLVGQLHSPILHEEDYFNFNAIIAPKDDKTEYVFSVTPKVENGKIAPVKIPMLLAQANLKKESYIKLSNEDSEDMHFVMNICGSLGINPESSAWSGATAEKLSQLPLELIGIPFALKYDEKNGFDAVFGLTTQLDALVDREIASIEEQISDTEGAFANLGSAIRGEEVPSEEAEAGSKTQELVGFDLSINKLEFSGSLNNPRLYMEPVLNVMGGDNSNAKNGFGLDAKVFIEGELVGKGYKFRDLGLERISVNVVTDVIKLKGTISYVKTELEKELQGALTVDIPGIGIGVTMAGGFGARYVRRGTTLEKEFSFWYARVMTKIDAGISIAGLPISAYGLGGGIFYNYKLSEDYWSTVGRGSFVPASNVNELYNKDLLEPAPNSFAIGLWALFAPVGTPQLVNFDTKLSYEMSGDVRSIRLEGNSFLMSELWGVDLEKKSMINGEIDGRLEFNNVASGDVTFKLGVDYNVNIPPVDPVLDGDISSELYVSKDNFHVYIGVPNGHSYRRMVDGKSMEPATLKTQIRAFGSEVDGPELEFYAMIGDGIPTQISLPDEITALLGNNIGDSDDFISSSDLGEKGAVGSGVAIGSAFKFYNRFYLWEGDLATGFEINATAGFDLNLTQSNSRMCNGMNPGVDGWYAQGQIYVGLDGKLDVLGKEVVGISAVAAVQGGFPNPTWLSGAAAVQFTVELPPVLYKAGELTSKALEGISDNYTADYDQDYKDTWFGEIKWGGSITGKFAIDFAFGDKCNPDTELNDRGRTIVPLIASLSPGRLMGNDGVRSEDMPLLDPLAIEVAVKLHNYNNRPIRMDIVEGGEIRQIWLTPRLESVEIKSRQGITTYSARDISDGIKKFIVSDFVFQPNISYQITATAKLYRGNEVVGSKVMHSFFRTDNLRTIPDEMITRSVPGKYQLYFHPGDEGRGIININPTIAEQINGSVERGSEMRYTVRNARTSEVLYQEEISIRSNIQLKLREAGLETSQCYTVELEAILKGGADAISNYSTIYTLPFCTSAYELAQDKYEIAALGKEEMNQGFGRFKVKNELTSLSLAEDIDEYDKRNLTINIGSGNSITVIEQLKGIISSINNSIESYKDRSIAVSGYLDAYTVGGGRSSSFQVRGKVGQRTHVLDWQFYAKPGQFRSVRSNTLANIMTNLEVYNNNAYGENLVDGARARRCDEENFIKRIQSLQLSEDMDGLITSVQPTPINTGYNLPSGVTSPSTGFGQSNNYTVDLGAAPSMPASFSSSRNSSSNAVESFREINLGDVRLIDLSTTARTHIKLVEAFISSFRDPWVFDLNRDFQGSHPQPGTYINGATYPSPVYVSMPSLYGKYFDDIYTGFTSFRSAEGLMLLSGLRNAETALEGVDTKSINIIYKSPINQNTHCHINIE